MNSHHTMVSLAITIFLTACNTLEPVRNVDDIRIGSLKRHELPPIPAINTDNSRQSAMHHYEEFLQETTENLLVPEALRRLADLHLAEEQQALMDGTLLPDQAPSRAAELYSELLQRYPDHPRNDSALYQLARAYEQNGDSYLAIQALSNYASKYDNNKNSDEVHFRRGEHLFVNQDYAAAELAYLSVAQQVNNATFHQQALYKLGWSRFKQAHYESALNAFIQLLDETIGQHNSTELPASLERADQERIEDTLRAISQSFAYLRDSSEIDRYFRRIGGRPYEPLIYAKLAGLYLAKERYTDAAETYRSFAVTHASHREAPLFHSRVIDVYKQAGFKTRVLKEKQAFIERYQPASTYWKQSVTTDNTDVLDQVQRHLRDITQYYHAEAQRKPTAAAFNTASYWYQLYLTAFPTQDQTPYINFLYAELLTTAGDHGNATKQYERTAYDYGTHKNAAEAGYAALLAYEKHAPALTGEQLSQWHDANINSAIKFAQTFPHNKQALPVLLHTAQQLYADKQFEKASQVATLIIERKDTQTTMQLSALTVIAHSQFELEDYLKAESVYQQILSLTPKEDNQRLALEEKLAASIYKQGEAARRAGDMEDATIHFLRVAKIVPTSSITMTARYDAAVLFIAMKSDSNAIKVLEAWRRDYPHNELNQDVTRKLAILYQDSGQPLKAAVTFERIVATEDDPAIKREASWTAATMYEKAGKMDRAISAWRNFIATFPHPVEQATEVRAKLVSIYKKSGDTDNQRQWQQAIVNADKNAGTERTDRTRFLAAHAIIDLTAPALAAYQRIKLREPLKQNLALKKQSMQKAIDGYTQAASYGIEEVTTTATYNIAEIYLDFSKDVMKSERPKNLNDEETEQYEILLEEQAYPFEEKAIEIYETNLQHMPTGTYDDAIKKSLVRLADILPVRYAKSERSESFVAP